jgi:glutathione S-transferase
MGGRSGNWKLDVGVSAEDAAFEDVLRDPRFWAQGGGDVPWTDAYEARVAMGAAELERMLGLWHRAVRRQLAWEAENVDALRARGQRTSARITKAFASIDDATHGHAYRFCDGISAADMLVLWAESALGAAPPAATAAAEPPEAER